MPGDRLCYSMELERGDLQLLNSYVTLHSRTPFEDFDAADRKRHLLRLWLAVPSSQPLPAAFKEYFGDVRAGAVRGGRARQRDHRDVPRVRSAPGRGAGDAARGLAAQGAGRQRPPRDRRAMKGPTLRRHLLRCLALLGCLPLLAQAAWPEHAIRIVVPFAAGGNIDLTAARDLERHGRGARSAGRGREPAGRRRHARRRPGREGAGRRLHVAARVDRLARRRAGAVPEAGLRSRLVRVRVLVFDHLGCVQGADGVGSPGFQALLRVLRARDDAWVKLSSWYRRSTSGPLGYVGTRPAGRGAGRRIPNGCMASSRSPPERPACPDVDSLPSPPPRVSRRAASGRNRA